MIEIKTHKRGSEIYRTERKKQVDCIIIHHTWSYSIDSCVNHWKGNKNGTHYIIDRDGTIYGMVPTLYKVNHCVGMNHNSVAIDLMRGEGEEILDVQYESLNRLISYVSSVYNIRDIELHKKGLFYHCDIRPTQCPKPIDDEKVWKWT